MGGAIELMFAIVRHKRPHGWNSMIRLVDHAFRFDIEDMMAVFVCGDCCIYTGNNDMSSPVQN